MRPALYCCALCTHFVFRWRALGRWHRTSFVCLQYLYLLIKAGIAYTLTEATLSSPDQMSESSPRKLKKKVSFAETPTISHPSQPIPLLGEPEHRKASWLSRSTGKVSNHDTGLLASPTPSGTHRVRSWFSSIRPSKRKPSSIPMNVILSPPLDPIEEVSAPLLCHPSPAAPSSTWSHHERYFPSFTETDIISLYPPPPIPTVSLHTFPSTSGKPDTPMEILAREHSSISGREVVLHYPDIPAFREYLSLKAGEGVGWGEAKWGTEVWTGYGWSGDIVRTPAAGKTGAAEAGGGAAKAPAGGAQPQGPGKKGKGKGGGGAAA